MLEHYSAKKKPINGTEKSQQQTQDLADEAQEVLSA